MSDVTPHASLKAEIEAAVIEAVCRVGLDRFDKAAMIKRFSDRGAGRSTLYRMVEAPLKSGRAGRALADAVAKAAAKAEEARLARIPAEKAEAVGELMPRIVTPDKLVTGGGVSAVEQITRCLQTAEKIMAHASTDEGNVKNAKLLIAATNLLRQTLETSIKLHAAMREGQALEAYQDAVLSEIAMESPECAERIHARLLAFTASWMG